MTLATIKSASRAQLYFLKRFSFHAAKWNVNTCQKHILSEDDNNNNGLILPQSNKKCVKVAFIGLPNVGKSTLVNQLSRRSICPASAKVHTTMHKADAVYIENDTQIVFMDTPGLVSMREMKKYKLSKSFRDDPLISISEADVIGIIQDVTNVYTRHKISNFVIDSLQNKREDTSLLLILNKVDKIKKKTVLLDLTRLLTNSEIYPKFDDIFMISALTGDGIDDLRNYLLDSAKVTEWKYEDYDTNQNIESIIVETVRAKLMDALPFQMPYTIKLQMEQFGYNDDGGIDSAVLLICPKQSYVRTLLKRKGEKIKFIAFQVEKNLRSAFRKSVFVRLIVKQEEKK
ncbi:GTPase Era, mitochondrial [Megachile rotundata]|uniref:GTPase Era, mitochondrial n=1 Tax=Megachile rotundata TaxID=143995 RepID=UPI000258EA6F|nr:PREDICTED: GTPase Era, mitochondrial [Megachile rotundata]